MSQQSIQHRAALPLWPFLLLLLIAYALPWLVNPGVSLTPGGYDLAEWASIHPAVRFGNPPLITSLLLRFPLACIALLAALNTSVKRFSWRWWLKVVFVGLIAAALLPPFEFFTIFRDDPNYQQQFLIALVVLLGGAVGVFGVVQRWRQWLTIALALVGAGMSLIGLLQAYQLMQQFRLPTQIGVGSIAMTLIFLALAAERAAHIIRHRSVISTTTHQATQTT